MCLMKTVGMENSKWGFVSANLKCGVSAEPAGAEESKSFPREYIYSSSQVSRCNGEYRALNIFSKVLL